MQRLSSRSGFTMVEMAIVIAIIGLIIGGVVAGRSMLRQSELNRVATTTTQYDSVFQQFKSQYKAIPGDMTNATRIWGAAAGSNADNWTVSCAGTSSTGVTATCNGNGDQNFTPNATYDYEVFRAWQQLLSAGLIGGRYSGVTGGGGTTDVVPDVNSPAGPLANTAFGLHYYTPGHPGLYAGIDGNILVFGKTLSGSLPTTRVLKGEDAASIDTKIDDGKPGTGQMTQPPGAANGCTTTTDPTTALYVLNDTRPRCLIYWKLSTSA